MSDYRSMHRTAVDAETDYIRDGWPSEEFERAAVWVRCGLWVLTHNSVQPRSALAALARDMDELEAARMSIVPEGA